MKQKEMGVLKLNLRALELCEIDSSIGRKLY